MSINIFIKTFGCKVNQYNSQLIKENIESEKNLKIVKNYKDADLFIINSCVVTEKSEKDVIKELKRYSKIGKVIVTGCVNKRIHNENIFYLDSKDLYSIKSFIKNLFKIQIKEEFIKNKIESFTDRTRAFVKIEEGCNKFCSYCIVPYLKGFARSRSVEEILDEIKILVNNGYKEIVLTGTEIGYYGLDTNDSLKNLLLKIINIKGNFRVRLSSIDPEFFSDDIIEIMKNSNKICPHIHLPLQSGSDKILEKMRRRYSISYYLDKAFSFKERVKNSTITTDIIVGFPYEEEEDFEKTIDAIKKVKFLKCHIFPYSKREKTFSYNFNYKIDKFTLKNRLKIINEVAKKVRSEVIKTFNNKELIVLTESEKNGFLYGYSENYIRVLIDRNYKKNSFYKVYLQIDENNVEYGLVLNEYNYSSIKGGEIKECQQYTEEKAKI